jgi:hypothetical protein
MRYATVVFEDMANHDEDMPRVGRLNSTLATLDVHLAMEWRPSKVDFSFAPFPMDRGAARALENTPLLSLR